MPWAAGSYTKGNNGTGGWVGDASLGIGIEAGRHDTQDNDFATGINQCLNKDGSNAATGNLNLGGFIPTNIGAGTAAAPAICAGNDVNTGVFGPAADTWAVATNGTERVRVLSDGKVGIGTAAPGFIVDVQSTATNIVGTRFSADTNPSQLILRKSRGATVGTNTIVSTNDSIGGLYFQGANGTGYTDAAGILCAIDGTPGASNDMPGRLAFFTTADGSGSPTERMRIASTGYVGIGTTPGTIFDIARNADDGLTRARIYNANSGSTADAGITFGNNTNQDGAAVYLNSSTNTSAAGVNGLTIINGLANVFVRATNTGGVNLAVGATSWAAVSDERLKKNIQSLSYGLNEILQLEPVRFDYKDDDSEDSKRMGFIAQAVNPIIPEAVTGTEDTYYGLSATELVPAMVNAIQELNAKVEALEAQVEMLQTQVALG
jgi:hypothetical protein